MNGPPFSQCSNDTWNLYQANGFFCCETDEIGFTSTETKTDRFYGCARDSTFDNTIMRSLSIIKKPTGGYYLVCIHFEPLISSLSSP